VLQAARIAIPDLIPTGIEDEIEIPKSIALAQNYPNPFNAETKIDFHTNGDAVSLEVFDLTGALVITLIDGSLDAGHHSVVWNGLDESGSEVASGIYFYRLNGSDSKQVKRMTLLK
jgi:flagellar hook assembly protein FlgD